MPSLNDTRRGRAVACRTPDRDCDELDLTLSRSWLRIGVAAVFAGQAMAFSLSLNLTPPDYGSAAYWLVHGLLAASALVVLGFIGGPLLRSTLAMVRARRLSIEGLFTLSLLGALVGSLYSTVTGEGAVYYEVVGVVLAVYTAGRMLGERSLARVIGESGRLREQFDRALLVDGDTAVDLPVAELTPGVRVRVDPGRPFTVDGVVVSGSGYVEETALSGEPLPVVRRAGDRVRAGTWSVDGSFEVRAEQVLGERELDRILEAVEHRPGRPSELQTQANDLMQAFLPLVAGVAAATAIFWAFTAPGWSEAVLNSMAVLLVACPCALGLATPIAVWQGLYRLSTQGLVSRNGDLVDALARTRHLFFDKTGTLSERHLVLRDLVVDSGCPVSREDLLVMLAALQERFDHPVARAFTRHRGSGAGREARVGSSRLLPGRGVEGVVACGGTTVGLAAGEPALAERDDPAVARLSAAVTDRAAAKRILILVDGRAAGLALLEETLRPGAGDLFARLAAMGIRSTVITGDPQPALAFDDSVEVLRGLSAAEKEALVRASAAAGERPVVIGDGINDAPAMAAAAGSIAIGDGAGLARNTASGQLTGDNPAVLPAQIETCRRIHRRLRGNLRFAAGYNTFGMGLAAAGLLHPVVAALIMVGSSLFVTARALRSAAPPPGAVR